MSTASHEGRTRWMTNSGWVVEEQTQEPHEIAFPTTISFQCVFFCDADIRKNLYRWHDHVPVDPWVRDEEIDSVDGNFFLKKKKQPEHRVPA